MDKDEAVLRLMTETQLLTMVRDILAKPGPLAGIDKVELAQINNELARRDLFKQAKRYHPLMEDTK